MKDHLLFINTTAADSCQLAIVGKTQVFQRRFAPRRRLSERLLLELFSLFNKARLPLSGLKGIVVVRGPGGFSSSRTGIAVANAFSYALKIPIAGKMLNTAPIDLKSIWQLPLDNRQPIKPIYIHPPHITKAKHFSYTKR